MKLHAALEGASVLSSTMSRPQPSTIIRPHQSTCSHPAQAAKRTVPAQTDQGPAQAVLLLVLGRRLVLGLDLPAVPEPLLLLGSWQIHLHNWSSYD